MDKHWYSSQSVKPYVTGNIKEKREEKLLGENRENDWQWCVLPEFLEQKKLFLDIYCEKTWLLFFFKTHFVNEGRDLKMSSFHNANFKRIHSVFIGLEIWYCSFFVYTILNFPRFFSAYRVARQKCGKFKIVKTKNVQYQNSNLIFALGVDWAIISFTEVGKGENLIIETFRGTENFCETVIWNFLGFFK